MVALNRINCVLKREIPTIPAIYGGGVIPATADPKGFVERHKPDGTQKPVEFCIAKDGVDEPIPCFFRFNVVEEGVSLIKPKYLSAQGRNPFGEISFQFPENAV